jgi:hypothetical protein
MHIGNTVTLPNQWLGLFSPDYLADTHRRFKRSILPSGRYFVGNLAKEAGIGCEVDA